MHNRHKVINELERSGNLPTLPHFLLKILSICNENDVDIGYLANTISKDPAISTEILKLINSAYYGLHQPVRSIKQAVVYLGPKTVQHLIAIMAIHQTFKKKRYHSQSVIDTEAFWYHSLMCATLAKQINEVVAGGAQDDIYLAGLLHDIGKLILATTFEEQYREVTATETVGTVLVGQEEKYLEINHCDVGSWLVRRWRMSPLIADAILYHHYPFDKICEGLPLVKIIYVANRLLEKGRNRDQEFEVCKQLLGIKRKNIEKILLDTVKEARNIAQQMGIRHNHAVSDDSLAHPTSIISEPGNAAEPDTKDSIHGQPQKDESNYNLQKAEEALSGQVKKISLLVPAIDSLMSAPDINGIFLALEKSFNLLFGIDKVFCLLPDDKKALLKGGTSEVNPLHPMIAGISLPIKENSSFIAQCYNEMVSPVYLSAQTQSLHLADIQVLNFLSSNSLLLVPLAVDKEPVGVVVSIPTNSNESEVSEDLKLIKTVTQQVAIRLYLENQKKSVANQIQAEKMAAVSLAARKLAHEINNPLGIISNCIAGMKLILANRNEVQQELRIIDEEIHRISAMTSQMDMFSQAPFTDFNQIDINKTIDDVIRLTKMSLFDNKDRTLTFIPGANIPPVTTSENAIKQILVNLIKNAAEAINAEGRVVVRTKKTHTNQETDREVIKVVVADTGPGVPDHILANLYKPLVSTKQEDHSGLGLSIVHKAIKDIGATITCSSKQGEGTTFTISLPTSLIQSPTINGEIDE